MIPRYPIYVPSKGRYARALTIRWLLRDRVPFKVVVEAEEYDRYVDVAGAERLLVLPESGQGLLFARNWIRDHAEATGADRHWQIDDNIQGIRRLYNGRRIPCNAGPAFAAVEDFTDRYRKVALSGLNYKFFVTRTSPPYRINVHVYSATLVNHACPYRWRLYYNDDVDICLQALTNGWNTILVNAFLINKMPTMTVKGGNTDSGGPISYQGDGRLRMARALEQVWPDIVRVDYRYGRPQHVIDWTQFRAPLRLKAGVDLNRLRETPNEYGLKLVPRESP